MQLISLSSEISSEKTHEIIYASIKIIKYGFPLYHTCTAKCVLN